MKPKAKCYVPVSTKQWILKNYPTQPTNLMSRQTDRRTRQPKPTGYGVYNLQRSVRETRGLKFSYPLKIPSTESQAARRKWKQ